MTINQRVSYGEPNFYTPMNSIAAASIATMSTLGRLRPKQPLMLHVKREIDPLIENSDVEATAALSQNPSRARALLYHCRSRLNAAVKLQSPIARACLIPDAVTKQILYHYCESAYYFPAWRQAAPQMSDKRQASQGTRSMGRSTKWRRSENRNVQVQGKFAGIDKRTPSVRTAITSCARNVTISVLRRALPGTSDFLFHSWADYYGDSARFS